MIERHPATAFRVFGSRVVLVPLERRDAVHNNTLVLSGSAVLLWEWLATPQTAESLASMLCDHYEVSAERARADVQLFLDRLTEWRAVAFSPV